MAIRAPWKGWLRTAMPILTLLILLNSLITLMLAITNGAALDLQYEDPPEYIQEHLVSIRASLLFFWCMIPLFLFLVSIAENWSLWTDHLGASYVILSSLAAIGLWALQLGLWESCVGGSTVAALCPRVYRHGGWGRYPDWAFSSPQGAGYAVPTIFVLYIVQICFAATVYRRQRRQIFRKSDMSQTWLRSLEEGETDSRAHLVAHSLENLKTPTTPEIEVPLTSDSERTSEETAHPARSRSNTITASWLAPLQPTASRPSLTSRRSTVSSLHDPSPTPTPSASERSFPASSLSDRSHPPLTDWSRGAAAAAAGRRSSSLSRYYTEYSVAEISDAEQRDAGPGSRPSEEHLDRRRRRSSAGLRELSLVRGLEGLGPRRMSGTMMMGGRRRKEGDEPGQERRRDGGERDRVEA